jgi:hypothetical protein
VLLPPTALQHLQFGLLVLLQRPAAAAVWQACPGSVVKPTLLLRRLLHLHVIGWM